MSWIFDNLQIVIVVGSTIAWWLTQRKQGEEEPPKHGERPGRQKIDFETLERNKRLREEIRRKREQRQAGVEPSEAPAPRSNLPDLEREITQQLPPVLREMMGMPEAPPPAAAPPPVPKVNPVLERQQRMEQEMAELQLKRREARALAARVGVNQNTRRRRARRTSDLNERDFLATLRDPKSARRAILLREILGKPVGLR